MMKRILFFLVLCSFFMADKLSAYNKTLPLQSTELKKIASGDFVLTNKGTCELRKYNSDFTKVLKVLEFEQVPTGLAVTDEYFYVTTFTSKGELHKVDAKTFKVVDRLELQSGAIYPVLTQDKQTLYVANQFSNTISKVDLKNFTLVASVGVDREPRCFVLSRDEKQMFVANFLPNQRADVDHVSAKVSVVDTEKFEVVKNIELANGSNALNGITLSPDGKYVLVTHNMGRFYYLWFSISGGWMNTAVVSVIETKNLAYHGVVILDEEHQGAATPERIAVTEDKILITHSGSHELSIIDYKPFIDRVEAYKDKEKMEVDLTILSGIRKRLPLKGNGPKILELVGDKAYIPTYFSDTLNVVDIKSKQIDVCYALQTHRQESDEFLGERIFNDARYCYEQWRSCSGCHPGGARHDGMNWDLMNDGPGNSKSCKSLLFSYDTAPSMISGIRASADIATRKGFEQSQYFDISESDAVLVDIYLANMPQVPSPYLVDGKLSAKAEKGKEVFEKIGCISCHSGEYYTDCLMHRIGDEKDIEQADGWDTPTLREVWRTAPYLFDGRAKTMKDVFVEFKHGVYTQVSDSDIDNLVEYVKSL
ncbi:MAG: DKNYY domain-containing protein [Rikenellaceae bacterium]